MARRGRQPQNKGKKNTPIKKRASQYDFTSFFVIVLLVLFGTVMIFSSSYYSALTSSAYNNDMFYFLKKQILWVALGLTAMIFMMNFNYQILKRFAFLSYIVANILLILVIFVGTEINGSKRWLVIAGISFQPSELAKIAIILYLSFYLSTHRDCLRSFKGFLHCLALLAIPVGLIGIKNLSTAIVALGIGGFILFVASPKIWYFVAAVIPVGIAGVAAVALPQFAYRFSRIRIWLDPFSDKTDDGYQIVQSLFAVASGGLFGLGLGQSRQTSFIPMAYNDIIFAIICEELGLFGAVLVILLFGILIWRGVKISMGAIDIFGCLTAAGIIAMIGLQMIINVAVVTNSIPNTGVPLPLVSYGGTSLVITMAAMGILLNISRYQKGMEGA